MIKVVEKSVTVDLEAGLQARPAARFVQEANRYNSNLYLEKEGKRINAKSIMGLMSLAVGNGETITLVAEGTDEVVAINDLTSFVTES